MVNVHYSEALIRRVVRHQMRTALGVLYWIALLMLGASFSISMLLGKYDWFLGMTGSYLVLACLIPLLAIRNRTKASIANLNALGEEGVSIELISGRFQAASVLGIINLPLSRITTVSCSPDYWLLKSGRSTIAMLPMADVPQLTADGWLHELRQAGAKVE